MRLGGSRPGLTAAVVAGLLLASPGCTTDNAPQSQTATTPTRTGPQRRVDVFGLVAAKVASRILGRRLVDVGQQLGAPRFATESCLLGTEFAVPVVEVQLTPGPVASETFEAAFGPAAGGEPRALPKLADGAFSRAGLTTRTLHVFTNGAVVTLEASEQPGDRLPRDAMTRLARTALARLPSNPALPVGRPKAPCTGVPESAVAAAMSVPVKMRRTFRQPDGSFMCSWSGLPGSVVISVHRNAIQVNNYRANLSPQLYVGVPGVHGEAWSQTDAAGDMLIFLGDRLVKITVVPAEGFASAATRSTPGEVRLANAAIAALT